MFTSDPDTFLCKQYLGYPFFEFDHLMDEAAHYWPLESANDIRELKKALWGHAINASSLKGIQGNALETFGKGGYFELVDNLSVFYKLKKPNLDGNPAITISFWLKYLSKRAGQVFLNTGNGRGFRVFQNGSFEQLAFQVTYDKYSCTSIIFTPQGIWSHFVLVWINKKKKKKMTIYRNGKGSTYYVENRREKVKPRKSNGKIIFGDFKDGSVPHAAIDEILVWYRALTEAEVKSMFHYYKGKRPEYL